jgi:hypothetical protein
VAPVKLTVVNVLLRALLVNLAFPSGSSSSAFSRFLYRFCAAACRAAFSSARCRSFSRRFFSYFSGSMIYTAAQSVCNANNHPVLLNPSNTAAFDQINKTQNNLAFPWLDMSSQC